MWVHLIICFLLVILAYFVMDCFFHFEDLELETMHAVLLTLPGENQHDGEKIRKSRFQRLIS